MTPHSAQLTFARGLAVESADDAGDGASIESPVAGAVVTGVASAGESRVSGDRIARSARRSVAPPPVSDQPAMSVIPANEASAIPILCEIVSGRGGAFMQRTVACEVEKVGTVPNTLVPAAK